jgi:hypothetical protein
MSRLAITKKPPIYEFTTEKKGKKRKNRRKRMERR